SDQFSDPAGKLRHTDRIGDLSAHLPYQIQLIDPEPFHRHTMGSAQADGDHTGQPLEQVEFIWFEFRSLGACNLKSPQPNPLVLEGNGSPGHTRGVVLLSPLFLNAKFTSL